MSVFQLFRFSAFRRSDTPLGPPVCLRLVDRHFWIRLGSIRASRVVLGALAEQLFLISDLWSLVAVAEQNAAFAEQSRSSTSSPPGPIRRNGSRRHFRIRLGSARASLRPVGSTEPEARIMPVRLGLLAPKQTSDDLIFDSGFSR